MLDIFFLSYDEPNAEANWLALKSRFPHARRVHGVKGIANAHIAAAKKSNTSFFYVVDADAEISEAFDFEYKPSRHEAEYVHVWPAHNPATGTAYGYGGVKLFAKKFFKDVKTQLDFTTTLTKDIKIMEEVACTTRFNSDPIRAFRGAFRESAKLHVSSLSFHRPEVQEEAKARLALWQTPLASCAFRQYVIDGVEAGQTAAIELASLQFINDHDFMLASFKNKHPEIDLDDDPTPTEDNPMKHELFFTTRLASALYDPGVLADLPMTELRDALSDGQLLSKNWLVTELENLIKAGDIPAGKLRVVIAGGWIGTLALMFNAREMDVHITSVDLDGRACRIAQVLNWGFDFKATEMDMFDVDYSEYDVIVNTSSEHIASIQKWRATVPPGKIVVVQNTDYLAGEGHISTVESSAELLEKLELGRILYEGTRKFQLYRRFMVIGQS